MDDDLEKVPQKETTAIKAIKVRRTVFFPIFMVGGETKLLIFVSLFAGSVGSQ